MEISQIVSSHWGVYRNLVYSTLCGCALATICFLPLALQVRAVRLLVGITHFFFLHRVFFGPR